MDEIILKIKFLGTTSSEVADALKTLGIKGVKSNPCLCPLSKVIMSIAPDLHAISNRDDIVVWRDQTGGPDGTFPTPPGCAAFLVDFDAGKYVELEQTLEEALA